MKYKGYTAQIEIDETAGILLGKVLDIKDTITFLSVLRERPTSSIFRGVLFFVIFYEDI